MTLGIGNVHARITEIRSRIDEIVKSARPAGESFDVALAKEQQQLLKAPEELRSVILDAARKNMLPPTLVDAVMRHESNYKSDAVSKAGAQGLMQLMPSTQKELGVADPWDPVESTQAGAKYLRMMADRFGGDLPKTLAAYNAGPGAVERHGGVPPFPETQSYVRRILSDLGTDDGEND